MTTDDRLVSGASSESSLPPNKSSGDIVERLCRHVSDRGGQFKDDDGNIVIPNGAWQMMIDAAAEIERLRREVAETRALLSLEIDRADLYANSVPVDVANDRKAAVAAAWEEAARVAKDRWREWRSSYEDDLDGMDACEDISKAISARASAIRAAVSKKTAESGHSPSTHNSASE